MGPCSDDPNMPQWVGESAKGGQLNTVSG